jgi:signal transduction histidine kinase
MTTVGSVILWLFLLFGTMTDSVKSAVPALAAPEALRLCDSASAWLKPRHLAVGRPDGRWDAATSLWFGSCTSGVRLRTVLSAPHAGRWWWVSELRTPEDLRLRLGGHDLGSFGTVRPFRERPTGSLPVAIPLDLHGGPETLSVTASDPQGDVEFEAELVPDARFPARLQNAAARDAWILGMFTSILLTALYLWRTVRERSFGWYAAYIATGIFWVSTKTGFASALLWPGHPAWNHAMPSFSSRLSLVLFLLFLRDLLELPRQFPRVVRLLEFGILWEAGCAVFALSSLWVPGFHAFVLHRFTPEILEGPTLLLGLSLVAVRAWRGHGLSRRILLSSLPLLLAAVFGSAWDSLHPDGDSNLDTPVAIAGALLENLLTTWVLAREVRRRLHEHDRLRSEFDLRLDQEFRRYRARVAANLHDDLSQRVMAARMALYVERNNPDRKEDVLDGQLRDLVGAIRDLSHHDHVLYPGQACGLAQALEELARSMDDAGLSVGLEMRAGLDLLPTVGLELYRVVQEALSNAVRHGGARRVTIALRDLGGTVELEVRDDGSGMAKGGQPGIGMLTMRERVELLGGTFEYRSRPSHGVVVKARLPRERAVV